MKHKFKKYVNQIFIETGSYTGDGIQAAINAGFPKIISIELSNKYYEQCKKRFKNNENVTIVLGDSINVLPEVLKNINERCTFWLDGHCSGGDTASGKYLVPLMQELLIIKEHHIKNHTILIDDMRLLKNHLAEWSNLNYSVKDIEETLLSINEEYKINYEYGMVEDDILVAKI